jgi:signal transduction histidine kinase
VERWRRGWQQIGGVNALTVWSWIATLPLALVVSSVYAGTPTITDVVVWTSIAIAVHALLGLVMWLAWLTILTHRERRSRPVTALVVFGAIGALRGLLMEGAQTVTGIGGGVFVERMGVNVIGGMVVFAAIAIVVDDFRIDADIRARLQEATQTLAMVRDEEERALQAADLDVLAGVQRAVQRALDESGTAALHAREVSERIVRPISHELADATIELEFPTGAYGSTQRRLRFADAFAATAAPSPVVVAVLIELAALGAVLGRYGPLVALTNALLGGFLVFLGGLAIRQLLPLPRKVLLRLITLAIAFAVVGVLSSIVVTALVSGLIAPFAVALPGVMAGIAAAAIVVSLSAAVVTGRRQRLDDMAQVVARSAGEVDRLRTAVQERRTSAARFLHGPIQGELVAAALRGDGPDRVRAAVRDRFAEYGSSPAYRAARDQVTEVVDAWSSILEVTFDIDEAVWSRLEHEPALTELLVDALSEGFTNVVRHSVARTVVVELLSIEDQIVLQVTSLGDIDRENRPGIGLDQVRRRGGEVELVSREGTTTLRFVL